MNLIIDEGNSQIKVALYKGDKQYFFKSFGKDHFEGDFLEEVSLKGIKKAIVSSVAKHSRERFAFLQEYTSLPVLHLRADTPVPFSNQYASPQTLGCDRIALVAGGMKRFPRRNVLVIDAGTCITFDFITKKKEYLGGAIAPGIAMRLKAMHHYTDKLPLIEEEDFDTENFVGNTTAKCMLSGVYNNVLREIEGVISQYKKKYNSLTTVLTGGNHFYLAERIKSTIFAAPFVLLEGMNAILEYQKRI